MATRFAPVAFRAKRNVRAGFDPPATRVWPPITLTFPTITVLRTVTCTTAAQFTAALGNIQGGDRINVTNVNFSGQVNIHVNPASRAEINFTNCNFLGGGAAGLNSVWVRGSNLNLRGSTHTNSTGHGMLFYECQNITWHDFAVSGTGGTCLRVFTTADAGYSDTNNLELSGRVTDCGNDLSLDPHAEKGSGLHPSYIGGVQTVGQARRVRNSRFFIDAYDCDTGSNQIGPQITGCDFYYRARNLNFVAQTQTGANAVQLFGGASVNDLDIWVEADRVAQVVRVTNEAMANIRVNHGRGTNVRGNYDSSVKYMAHAGVAYSDCT